MRNQYDPTTQVVVSKSKFETLHSQMRALGEELKTKRTLVRKLKTEFSAVLPIINTLFPNGSATPDMGAIMNLMQNPESLGSIADNFKAIPALLDEIDKIG